MDQAWKLDRGTDVGLVELYAGRARLSDEFEQACPGSEAIRLGLLYGQDLRSAEGQWYALSLIDLCKPRDVFVAFPSRGWCRRSRRDSRKRFEDSRSMLRERREGMKDLSLLFRIVEKQAQAGRFTHAQNPRSSLAWKHCRFQSLRVPHGFAHFHQCMLGLLHPRTGRPICSEMTVFTTSRHMAEYMGRFRCNHTPSAHDHACGSDQCRTSWCEDYESRFSATLIAGMGLGAVPGDTEYESPHFAEHIFANSVQPCFVASTGMIHQAFPGTDSSSQPYAPPEQENPSTSPDTVFKVLDQELSKQLNALQFPGRYRKVDLPIPVQAQLQRWSGVEVDTIVTSKHLKCFVPLPKGVIATKRTTLARVSGDWFYVEHCKELPSGHRRLRLPVNASLVVTFFGDMPAARDLTPAEAQPRPQTLPGAPQAFSDARKVRDYLNRLHVGLGHCGNSEFVQHLKDAGAAPWLLQQAKRFTCPVCDAQQPPPSHSVIGGPKPRSFNSVLSIDTLDLTLVRDGVQYRVFLLTAVDTATSFARAFLMQSGDSQAAIQALERGWLQAYGSPEYIYADPDTIFRSEDFASVLTRHAIIERLSAAQAPFQHGQVERLHRTLRAQAQKVFEAEPTCSPYDAVTHVIQARNELMRVEGVSPSVLVFGKLPRAPPSYAEGDEDFQLLAERLQNSDPLYEVMMLRRVAARTAWVQAEVRDRTSRVLASRPRPYKGPYVPGQAVLAYRRRKADAANPGRHGVWLGPGEIVAVESTNDRLVPRIIYVTVHGRLFLCSPDQLRPISIKADWVRQRLKEDGLAQQRSFGDMRKARGIDVRNERPSSAELEQAYEQPLAETPVEDLKEEAEYEPCPQGPPTPLPGTPVPSTPVPGTPRPPTELVQSTSTSVGNSVPPSGLPPEPPLGNSVLPSGLPPAPETVVPVDQPTPPGGEGNSSEVEASTKRGSKREAGEHITVEDMAQSRAQTGPSQLPPLPEVTGTVPATVVQGGEPRSRARSRTPPPREGSFLSIADFSGAPTDHVQESWFTESQEHDYDGHSIGLSFNVGIEELQDEMSVVHIVREMAFNASMARRRAIEVTERRLNSEEREMFRTAKRAEWSQWLSNDVVELISRFGVDPRRIIESRWVLTWKSVPGEVYSGPGGTKAKARLVIRGFRDPDLGQYSTASPTLSRQGRHAVFTVASHLQYRVFTLDAKTAFLS